MDTEQQISARPKKSIINYVKESSNRLRRRIRAQKQHDEIMWVDDARGLGPLSVKVADLPEAIVKQLRSSAVRRFQQFSLKPDDLAPYFAPRMKSYLDHIETINRELEGKLFPKDIKLSSLPLEIAHLPNDVFAINSTNMYLNIPIKPGTDLDVLCYLLFMSKEFPDSLPLSLPTVSKPSFS